MRKKKCSKYRSKPKNDCDSRLHVYKYLVVDSKAHPDRIAIPFRLTRNRDSLVEYDLYMMDATTRIAVYKLDELSIKRKGTKFVLVNDICKHNKFSPIEDIFS